MLNRKEFEDSLTDAIAYWGNKSRSQVTAAMGREAGEMVGYDQKNPHHCYDLFMHTLHVVDGLPAECPAELRVAAFFHDIGKPRKAFFKQGRRVFYGHAAASAEIAEPILRKLGYSPEETELICFFIRQHDMFISFAASEEDAAGRPSAIVAGRETVSKAMQKTSMPDPCTMSERDIWKNLTDLCIADAAAQAETTYLNGKLNATRELKVTRARVVQAILAEITAEPGAEG